MAITVETRTKIIELTVGMVNAAPGAAILSELAEIVDAGLSLGDLAIAIANNPAFKTLYPSFLSSEEFATNFLNTLLGSEVSATVKADAIAAMVADLNSGTHRGTAMYTAITTLSAAGSTDTNYGAAATALANKVDVANYYSVVTQQSSESLSALVAVVAPVTSSAATVTAAKSTIDGTANGGNTYTLTNVIDNLLGTSGNDIFIGDNTSANAGDQINGGGGNDVLKLFGTTAFGNLTSVESLEINNNTGSVNTAAVADLTNVTLQNTDLTAAPTYTLATGQTMSLVNVSDATNTGNALTLSGGAGARTLNLNGVGSVTGNDVVIDNGSATITTLNLNNSGAASKVTLNSTAGTISTVNISGSHALTIQAGGTVDAEMRAITITNTGGATLTTSATPSATTGLTVTGAGGKDNITLAQAAGANALTDKVAVDLGAGDDSLMITNLTAATDINSAASFNGGDGTDTLTIVAGAVLDATRGKLFSNFETFAAVGGNYNMSFLASTNTIGTLAMSTLAANVVVTNLAEASSVAFVGSTGAFTATINQKDAGAGSPDDVINVAIVGSTTGSRTVNSVDLNDIETVNVSSSGGSTTTQTFTTFIADEATKITAAAGATLVFADLQSAALVLFDASSSTAAVSVTTTDAYNATSGVAFKGGAGADTFTLTGATTAGAGLEFVMTGNGGADAITLSAAGQVEHVVYLAQSDSTSAKFDSVSVFTTTEDKLDLKAFGFTGAADDAVLTIAGGVSVNGVTGAVEVTSAAAGNFFNDAGLDRGVAEAVVGGDLYIFVDADKNGDFTAAGDLVIKLVGLGAAGFDVGDVIFA